jgi:hypothetical protein
MPAEQRALTSGALSKMEVRPRQSLASRLEASVAGGGGNAEHEAYTAVAWGVRLSHERSDIAGAEGFHSLEGNMCGTVMRGADALPGFGFMETSRTCVRPLWLL